MVSTRLSTKDKKLVVSKQISDYFTKLVEPLDTMQMFTKLKKEIIERFEEKFAEQDQKIVD